MTWLYFISAEGVGATKIGLSRNPSTRLREMQTGCPSRLTLDGSWPCHPRYERAVHNLLHEHHLRGEWFATTAVDLLCARLAEQIVHRRKSFARAVDYLTARGIE